MYQIMTYLSEEDLFLSCRQVCQRWCTLTQDPHLFAATMCVPSTPPERTKT